MNFKTVNVGLAYLLITVAFRTAFARVAVYEDANFQGASRALPPIRSCLNFPPDWRNRVSSVDTEGGCIILCVDRLCQGHCEKIYPGTAAHHDLEELGLNDKFSSFKGCEIPSDNEIPLF